MSSKQLKIIAIATMVIDHFSAAILYALIVELKHTELADYYYLLRHIGRIAFPIYCFLLVEGFFHTHSRLRYLCSMGMFALISEVPFDLCLRHGVLIDFGHQNVFFTLSLGLICLWGLDTIIDRFSFWSIKTWVAGSAVVAAISAIAYFAKTDYKFGGILCIVAIYLVRKYSCGLDAVPDSQTRFFMIVSGCMALALYQENEIYCLFSMIPCLMYDGSKGNIKHKYFYYLVYPVHMLVLGLISSTMTGIRVFNG